MFYVIQNVDTGKWVARSGSAHSYTDCLQRAQIFRTREAAQADCCGNERIQSLDQVFAITLLE